MADLLNSIVSTYKESLIWLLPILFNNAQGNFILTLTINNPAVTEWINFLVSSIAAHESLVLNTRIHLAAEISNDLNSIIRPYGNFNRDYIITAEFKTLFSKELFCTRIQAIVNCERNHFINDVKLIEYSNVLYDEFNRFYDNNIINKQLHSVKSTLQGIEFAKLDFLKAADLAVEEDTLTTFRSCIAGSISLDWWECRIDIQNIVYNKENSAQRIMLVEARLTFPEPVVPEPVFIVYKNNFLLDDSFYINFDKNPDRYWWNLWGKFLDFIKTWHDSVPMDGAIRSDISNTSGASNAITITK